MRRMLTCTNIAMGIWAWECGRRQRAGGSALAALASQLEVGDEKAAEGCPHHEPLGNH